MLGSKAFRRSCQQALASRSLKQRCSTSNMIVTAVLAPGQCRVAVGEYCQGVKDSITPGGTPFGNFRLPEKKVLYDSAVRDINEKDPRGPQMVS